MEKRQTGKNKEGKKKRGHAPTQTHRPWDSSLVHLQCLTAFPQEKGLPSSTQLVCDIHACRHAIYVLSKGDQNSPQTKNNNKKNF